MKHVVRLFEKYPTITTIVWELLCLAAGALVYILFHKAIDKVIGFPYLSSAVFFLFYIHVRKHAKRATRKHRSFHYKTIA